MGQFVYEDEDDDRKTHCCANREKNRCVEDWSSFPSKELCPIRMIIENDDADKFDSFLKKSKIVYRKDDEMLKYGSFEMCPYGLLGKMCHHRAVKCATMLLSRRRKVGSLMKLNIVNCYGTYPLHDAAISLSASMVKLFLDRGASLDARSLDAACISPLEYAVERLSCDTNLIHWSPNKSIFKLIITLCLPQMKEALETIDLLAGVSASCAVMNDTIFSAVKRGQVVPVAVLLLLAQDRVMQSFYQCNKVSSGRYLLFPEAIMNELATLINQETALVGSKEHTEILQLCRAKKELMIYFLQLIEIFNRAGPALKSYLEERISDVTNEQVSHDVAELLKGSGLVFSTKNHDISHIKSSPKPDLVPLDATLKQHEYDDEDDPKDFFFKPCREQICRCDMRIPSCTTSNVFQRIVGSSFLYNHYRGFSSHAGPSIHQPLWTFPRRDICFLTRSPKVANEQVSPDVADLLKGAGLVYSTKNHDISHIMSSPKPDLVPLDATLKQHEYDDEVDPKDYFFKPCGEQICRCDMRITSCTTSNVFQRIVGSSFLQNHHRGFSSLADPSIHQPLWTFPRRDSCFLTRSPKALEEKRPKKQAEEKKMSILRLSLPRSLTAALKPGLSYSPSEAFKHLGVKKISSLVFSAVKKGKA